MRGEGDANSRSPEGLTNGGRRPNRQEITSHRRVEHKRSRLGLLLQFLELMANLSACEHPGASFLSSSRLALCAALWRVNALPTFLLRLSCDVSEEAAYSSKPDLHDEALQPSLPRLGVLHGIRQNRMRSVEGHWQVHTQVLQGQPNVLVARAVCLNKHASAKSMPWSP